MIPIANLVFSVCREESDIFVAAPMTDNGSAFSPYQPSGRQNNNSGNSPCQPGHQHKTIAEGGLVVLGQNPAKWRFIFFGLIILALIAAIIFGVISWFGPKVSAEQVASNYKNIQLQWIGKVNPKTVTSYSGDDYRKKLATSKQSDNEKTASASQNSCVEKLSSDYKNVEAAVSGEVIADKPNTKATITTTIYRNAGNAAAAMNQVDKSITSGCSPDIAPGFSIKKKSRGWAFGSGYLRYEIADSQEKYLGEIFVTRSGNTLSQIWIDYPDAKTAKSLKSFWLALSVRKELSKQPSKDNG